MDRFVERLFDLCKTDSLTEVARQTGVPYNTLKNYASGSGRMPSAEVLAQIARSTHANLNWLLLGEGTQQTTLAPTPLSKADFGLRIVGIEIPPIVVKVRFSSDDVTEGIEEHIPLYTSKEIIDTPIIKKK